VPRPRSMRVWRRHRSIRAPRRHARRPRRRASDKAPHRGQPGSGNFSPGM